MTTIETNGAEVTETAVVPSLPSSGVRNFYSKSGKLTAREYAFDGKQSASALRKALKEGGHKGKAIDRMVKEALSGEEGARWVSFNASVAELRNRGHIPDSVKVQANGESATFKTVKATESIAEKNASKAKEEARRAKVEAAALEMGLTAEQVAKLAAID